MKYSEQRFLQLGWVFAAALLAVVVGGGFQASSVKIGVVDITKVIEDSGYGKETQAAFRQMQKTREELLEFIDTNRVLTTEQSQRLRDLTIKPNPTAEEKAEMDRIKAEVVAANRKWAELSTKSTPLTPEERTLLEEYSRRSQSMGEFADRLLKQFTNEIQGWASDQKVKSLERARTAVQTVAKAEGYTVILEVGIAPYGASDVTEAARKAMDSAQ
jgi:Skp family chaperone for outer membrane proteins